VSTSYPCNCNDTARWKKRALAAELSLAFARRQLEDVIKVMPGDVTLDCGQRTTELESAEKGAAE